MAALAQSYDRRAWQHYAPLEIKRNDAAMARASDAGVFEGYASLFNVLDSGGDIVAPGAFTASLRKRGAAQVKMLWQHKADEPIGVWTRIFEDARGLKVAGRFDMTVARAREALSLLRAGAVDGLSIGFRTVRAARDKETGARRLLEVDLWEVSLVTFPMLAQARVATSRRPPAPTPRDGLTNDELGTKLLRLRARVAAANYEAKLLRLRTVAKASSP